VEGGIDTGSEGQKVVPKALLALLLAKKCFYAAFYADFIFFFLL
jgi:hypothetical protein